MFQSNWFKVLLVLFFAGLAKGALHIVKIVILAGLGLAGMWMLHTLAQDYDKISNKFMGGKSFLSKRSVDAPVNDADIPEFPQLKWDLILAQDPEDCVPSFICQLAAASEESLQHNEKIILKLIRATSEKFTKATKKVRQALQLGEIISPAYCQKYYPLCPYSRGAMLSLLETYGG